VVDYMLTFRLGSEETTRKVLVKHLVCACTGLPCKDMQWVFYTTPGTKPAKTCVQLAATQPTSGFGEVFQYNNLMASAAGYLAAHILYPSMELAAGGSLHALADSGAGYCVFADLALAANRLIQEGDISPRSISGAHASCPRARGPKSLPTTPCEWPVNLVQ
jgi:hypothetical protein